MKFWCLSFGKTNYTDYIAAASFFDGFLAIRVHPNDAAYALIYVLGAIVDHCTLLDRPGVDTHKR